MSDVSVPDGLAPHEQPAWMRLTWASQDRYRWLTPLWLLGLLGVAALALLGLPPVDLHPPLHRLGVMDPLCGGTRSVRYAAIGQIGDAWRYNPLGIVVVAGVVLAVARTLIGLVTGRWLRVELTWSTGRKRAAIVIAVALLAALEVRQQLRAGLLLSGS